MMMKFDASELRLLNSHAQEMEKKRLDEFNSTNGFIRRFLY